MQFSVEEKMNVGVLQDDLGINKLVQPDMVETWTETHAFIIPGDNVTPPQIYSGRKCALAS